MKYCSGGQTEMDEIDGVCSTYRKNTNYYKILDGNFKKTVPCKIW
jgi:hypothetical protein